MQIIIEKPGNISEDQLNQFTQLVKEGGEIKFPNGLEERIQNCMLLGILKVEEEISAIIALKQPTSAYIAKKFAAAGVAQLAPKFSYELGYVVTRESFRGKKLCQKLLQEFIPHVRSLNIYGTTRKPEIIHILGKFNFGIAGEKFDEDLHLLIYSPKK